MTGPTSVESSAGLPIASVSMTPASSSITRGAMSSWTKRTRSAEQRWPAALKAEVTASFTTCSGSAELSTSIAFWPPVSAISTGSGPSLAASERLMSRAVSVEPVKATPAMRGSPVSVGPIFEPRPGTRCSTSPGMPLACSRRTICGGDERRLLRGLRDHGIAGGERRRHLAGEDREREIPGADAGEDPAAAQREAIRFAGRARQQFRLAEVLLGPRRVVAQEVHGLAHLGNRVRHGLAGLRDADGDEARHVALEPVGGVAQHLRTRGGRHAIPFRLRGRRQVDRPFRQCGIRVGRLADHAVEIRGRAAGAALALLLAAPDDRRARRARCKRRAAVRGELPLLAAVGQVDARRIPALRAEEVARRGDARMRAAARALDVGDRVADDFLDRQRLVHDAVHEGRVGAVLEQAPHEVWQQFLVRAYRGVHATREGAARRVGQFGVELLAHAVQALEFESAAARLREVDDGCRRVRVVRRELRIDARAALEQESRAGQVRDVGVGLSRVHRIARKASLLGALHFAVPVGALHEAQVEHASA